MSAAALLTAAGVVVGSWSVWSVVGPTAPSGKPAPPLWFSPPALEITGTTSSTVDTPMSGPAGEHGADGNPGQTGSAPATKEEHPGSAATTEEHTGPTSTTSVHLGRARGEVPDGDDHSGPSGGGHG
jgi:hypothetical protein